MIMQALPARIMIANGGGRHPQGPFALVFPKFQGGPGHAQVRVEYGREHEDPRGRGQDVEEHPPFGGHPVHEHGRTDMASQPKHIGHLEKGDPRIGGLAQLRRPGDGRPEKNPSGHIGDDQQDQQKNPDRAHHVHAEDKLFIPGYESAEESFHGFSWISPGLASDGISPSRRAKQIIPPSICGEPHSPRLRRV